MDVLVSSLIAGFGLIVVVGLGGTFLRFRDVPGCTGEISAATAVRSAHIRRMTALVGVHVDDER